MKLSKRGWVVALGAITAIALSIGLSSVASGSDSVPSWVNSDGTVDTSKMPARMPMLDSRGNVMGYVKTSDLNAPPRGRGKDPKTITVYAGKTGTKVVKQLPFGSAPDGGVGPAPVISSRQR